ncbi:MAG: phenylacetate--CoA ligase family protein [Moorellales bacterium]
MYSDQLYWNPVLETLPREKLRQLQFEKFKEIFTWAYEHSGMYRALYDEAGITPDDLRTWEDIQRVPLAEKAHYRDAQCQDPWPYGKSLCVPIEEVVEFHQTSGTTGQPIYQPDTWADWEWCLECWCYILWAMGFRPSDRVFIPFVYNVNTAYWQGHYAAEKLGCEVIPGGGMGTEERLLKMKELRPTAFMATPTYVLNLATACKEKLGMDPRELGIKKILCAGEPGASIPNTKRRMEELWGAKVFDHAGGTEIGAWGYECTFQPGGMHVNEAFYLVELLDLETGQPIEEPGKLGRLVITAFGRLAQPCIRYDTKDVTMWGEPCACGRTFRVAKGGVQGRTDHITKVKGVLFSPASVEEVVRGFPELGDEYELIVTKKGDIDDILLRIEPKPGVADLEPVLERLRGELWLRTNLHIKTEVCPYGSLPRYEAKAKRFKDLRGGH